MKKIDEKIAYILENNKNYQFVHGSGDTFLENIAFSIGLESNKIDENIMNRLISLSIETFTSKEAPYDSDFFHMVIANTMLFALRDKMDSITLFKNYFLDRLNRLFVFVNSNSDLFYSLAEKEAFKGVPLPWKNQQIMRKENTDPFFIFPQVYDLLGFYAMYDTSDEVKEKIDRIIDYLFSDKYLDETKNGYGIGIKSKSGFTKGKYFAVGWNFRIDNLAPSEELTYMVLLSRFSSGRNKEWYKNNILKYQQNEFVFDNKYFESRTSYWMRNHLYSYKTNQFFFKELFT